MKSKFIIPSLILAAGSLCISCDSDDSIGEEEEMSAEISTTSLTGFIDSEAFTPATTHFEKSELFGDVGYDIKLFKDVEECDEFQSIGDVSFFVASEADLTEGTYEGKGPFFRYGSGDDSGSVSFFGAQVIIEEVGETSITGRVKGGDDNSEHFIEGRFVAVLCQK